MAKAGKRTILVTGATGRQGRGLIRALLQADRERQRECEREGAPETGGGEPGQEVGNDGQEYEYHVLALTRNPSSEAARSLRGLACSGHAGRIALVQGDLSKPESVRRIFEDAAEASEEGGGNGIWGVFAVLAYPGLGAAADVEERQGRLLADLALEFRVQAFVYTSVLYPVPGDEGVDESHRAKRRLEQYCRDLGGKGLNWTIIRPGFFMENFEGFLGSIAVGLLSVALKKDTKITLIASEDIGSIAAGVFQDPERFRHKILSATSGPATMAEITDSYRRATGRSMPSIPTLMAKALYRMNGGAKKIVKEIERSNEARVNGEDPHFAAEVELAQSVFMMQTYYEWKLKAVEAEKEAAEGTEKGKWNQLSLFKLFTGRS